MLMAATTRSPRSLTGAATHATASLDSQYSSARPFARMRVSRSRSRTGEVRLRGVSAGKGWSSGNRALSVSGSRLASSMRPTAVQCAGSRRPTAETMRTGWVLSTLAM